MANIDLLSLLLPYGDRTIKVKAKASGYSDSDFSNSVTYHSAPIIAMDSEDDSVLVISNLRAAATGYQIYLNGTLNTTVPYSGSDGGSMNVDLDSLSDVPEGSLSIYVKGTGTGVEDNTSNTLSIWYGSAALPIYGVSGMYSESTSLTRTDASVGKSATVDPSTGLVNSDFDALFPWNEAEVKTVNGNKFLQMPDMYFRIGKDSSNRITDIAVSKMAGADDSTHTWHKVDSFYYGCYGGSVSNNKLASVSGVARQHTKTRAEFRTYATNNGSGYFQLDLYHKMVMTFLWLIEFANKDSQSIMRGRDSSWGGTAAAVNTGGTDSLTKPSGYNTTTKQMRWHYIEDFIGNYWEFVDGMVWSSTQLYVSSNPANYGDTTTGHSAFGPSFLSSAGNCLAAIGWDSNKPFLCYGVEAYNDSNFSKGFADGYYYAQSTSVVFYSGAAWSAAGAYVGVLNFNRNTASYASSSIGGRLLYKP